MNTTIWLGRTRLEWEDNIKMYLVGMNCKYMYWRNVIPDKIKWRCVVVTAVTFLLL
jgi:hypothetical protein